MITAMTSEKGQITIPAAIRRKLGMKPKSRVEVEVADGQIVLRPVASIMDLAGVFHSYAECKTADWGTERARMEEVVARAVLGEDSDYAGS